MNSKNFQGFVYSSESDPHSLLFLPVDRDHLIIAIAQGRRATDVDVYHESRCRVVPARCKTGSSESRYDVFGSGCHTIRIADFDNLLGLTVKIGVDGYVALPALLVRENAQVQR